MIALIRSHWLALAALGLGVLVLTAVLRGTPEDSFWYASHIVPFVIVVLLCSQQRVGAAATIVLVLGATLLSAAVLLTGLDIMNLWHDGIRVSLFTDNPNLLAADLVSMTIAAVAVKPKAAWIAWAPVVVLAVISTGSRTALIALLAAVVTLLLTLRCDVRTRLIVLFGLSVIAAIAIAAMARTPDTLSEPNLLWSSTTFAGRSWSTHLDASVTVTPGATIGPYDGTSADRIIASTVSHALALYQWVGPSEQGAPYVASVYLRADEPHHIIIGNHFTREICAVSTVWQRCVTPVGIGNGRTASLFTFETRHPGEAFDVFAYGPQYERGQSATPYTERGGNWVSPALFARLSAWKSLRWNSEARLAAMKRYFALLKTAPLLGHGLDLTSESRLEGERLADSAANHAHNLLLERATTDGAVGLLAWAIIFFPLLVTASVRYGGPAIAWLVALAVLNSFDMTLLHAGTYYSIAIVCGTALRRRRVTPLPM